MPALRTRPFATDGQSQTGSETDRIWQQRVAEAAGRAADDLAEEDDPQRRALYTDLRTLEARMTAGDDGPPAANDPRGDAL